MSARLLVVDDDPAFWAAHQGALSDAFAAELAADPKRALPLLKEGGFQGVLISVEVARCQGYGLCAAIRKQEELRGLKVALISSQAGASEFDRHRTLRGRADTYFRAPIQPSALVEGLHTMFLAAVPEAEAPRRVAPPFWKRLFS